MKFYGPPRPERVLLRGGTPCSELSQKVVRALERRTSYYIVVLWPTLSLLEK